VLLNKDLSTIRFDDDKILHLLLLIVLAPCAYQISCLLRTCVKALAPAVQLSLSSIPGMQK
jgi:hypothetical protein